MSSKGKPSASGESCSSQEAGAPLMIPKASTSAAKVTKADMDKIAKEEVNMAKICELYKRALNLQANGCEVEAHKYYGILTPFLGTDPMIWLRIAECCVDVLYKAFKKPEAIVEMCLFDKHNEVAQSNLVALSDSRPLSDQQVAALREKGISMEHAETAMITCHAMLWHSRDISLKLTAHCLSAFIALKRGRLRNALEDCEIVLNRKEAFRYMIIRVTLIKVEVHLIRCEYAEAAKACDGLFTSDSLAGQREDVHFAVWSNRILSLFCQGGNKAEEAVNTFTKDFCCFHPFRESIALAAFLYKRAGRWDEFVRYCHDINEDGYEEGVRFHPNREEKMEGEGGKKLSWEMESKKIKERGEVGEAKEGGKGDGGKEKTEAAEEPAEVARSCINLNYSPYSFDMGGDGDVVLRRASQDSGEKKEKKPKKKEVVDTPRKRAHDEEVKKLTEELQQMQNRLENEFPPEVRMLLGDGMFVKVNKPLPSMY